MVIVAPAAAAPLESLIVPSNEPLTACPAATVKTLAQVNASNNSLFAMCINNLLIESYFHSTHRGVSSGFSPSLVSDCFKLAKVSLDARRKLRLPSAARIMAGNKPGGIRQAQDGAPVHSRWPRIHTLRKTAASCQIARWLRRHRGNMSGARSREGVWFHSPAILTVGRPAPGLFS